MMLRFKRLAQNLALLVLLAFSGMGHAAITLVNSFGNNGNSATTLSMAPPVTGNLTIAGDVMVAMVSINNGTGTINTPAGWTLINSVATGTRVRQSIYWKVAGASEGTTTWTFGATHLSSGILIIYRGVVTVSPVDVFSGQAVTSGTTTPIALAVSPTVTNERLIGCFTGEKGALTFTYPPLTPSPPGGLTVVVESKSLVAIAVFRPLAVIKL